MRTVKFTEPMPEGTEERVARWRLEKPGERPIRLDSSVPGQPMHGAPLAAMQAAVAELGCKGTFPGAAQPGGGMLREAAAEERTRSGAPLTQEEVFAFPGLSAALGALLGLAKPKASVLIQSPGLPLYTRATALAGHLPHPLAAGEKSAFRPLPDRGSTTETDIIVLASPSPASGAAYSAEQLSRWVEFATAQGALLILDTTYAAYAPQDVPRGVLQSTAARACAVELRDISAVEGFCATPCTLLYVAKELAPGGTPLYEALARRAACADGVAHPVARAAAALLAAPPAEPTAGWRETAVLLSDTLEEMGAHYFGGKDAPFFWVRCPIGYEYDSRAFFEALLENTGTVCTPGAAFGAAGEGWFRLSALCDKNAAEIAMKRLRRSFQF